MSFELGKGYEDFDLTYQFSYGEHLYIFFIFLTSVSLRFLRRPRPGIRFLLSRSPNPTTNSETKILNFPETFDQLEQMLQFLSDWLKFVIIRDS